VQKAILLLLLDAARPSPVAEPRRRGIRSFPAGAR
jgi:hypothetical protein